MQVLKRTTVAVLAAMVLFTSTYVNTIEVYATTAAGGLVGDETLLSWILSFIYEDFTCFYGAEAFIVCKGAIDTDFSNWAVTSGKTYVQNFADASWHHLKLNNKGLPDKPPNDPRSILLAVVAEFAIGTGYLYLRQLKSAYLQHLENDTDILSAYDQDITYNSVLPDCIVYMWRDVTYDTLFSGLDSSFDVVNNSYLQAALNNGTNQVYELQVPFDSGYVNYLSFSSMGLDRCTAILSYVSFDDLGVTDSFEYYAAPSIDLSVSYPGYNGRAKTIVNKTYNPRFSGMSIIYGTGYIYTNGNCIVATVPNSTEELYYIASDGTVLDLEGNVYAPSITTEEGKLLSAKAIVGDKLSDFSDKLADRLEELFAKNPSITKEQIEKIFEQVSNYYSEVVENYYQDTTYVDGDTYFENITNIFEQVLNPDAVIDDTGIIAAIKSIPVAISKVLTDIFVPDPEVIGGYVGDVLDHFKWIKEPWDFADDLVHIIFNPNNEPPVIYIHLEYAESYIDYGGKTPALDMTWYARYKNIVDNIILGFCWICFGYWFFRNLPEIISGSSPAPMFRAQEKAISKIEKDHNKTSGKSNREDG